MAYGFQDFEGLPVIPGRGQAEELLQIAWELVRLADSEAVDPPLQKLVYGLLVCLASVPVDQDAVPCSERFQQCHEAVDVELAQRI